MAKTIYLVAREVDASDDYGHAFLLLWDDVDNKGKTIGANQNSVGLGQMLAYVDLPNEVPPGDDPDDYPEAFEKDDFPTLNKTEITGIGDASSVWAQLIAQANSLDAVYGYDLASGALNGNTPVVNSNAFIFSLLNGLDIDPRPLFDAISGIYSEGLLGIGQPPLRSRRPDLAHRRTLFRVLWTTRWPALMVDKTTVHEPPCQRTRKSGQMAPY